MGLRSGCGASGLRDLGIRRGFGIRKRARVCQGASGIDSDTTAILRASGNCARVCRRRATTFDAFARDIQCFVGLESIADFTAHQHRTDLNLIASLTGTVTTSGNLLHDRHGWPLD
ncbi:hypothetical protein [Rhodococcus sp. SBT000017]|uniref:hypothetical protein n=1 Tax=Rhodococcus sp. SBT000017 TaxID=1803385 RepID=UPI0011C352C4|nr:hypothetical protein [Rhodococcus sp. SBT000017]